MPKVSVIIPVYGVEKYIERCVRTLFEQTLDDIEYIFVNDCTKDRSIDILRTLMEEYPQRAQQVILYNMPVNSGQAKVREKGIQLATGEYIIHCDPDDFISREMYESMYSKAIANNSDIVVCAWEEGNDEHSFKKYWDEDKRLLSMILIYSGGALWNKLVRRDIVKHDSIAFPEHNMGEDLCLVAQYSVLAKKVDYVNQPFYFYYRHPESLLGDRSVEALLIKQRQMRQNFAIALQSISNKISTVEYTNEIVHECLYIKNMLLPVLPYGDYLSEWKETFSEINSKVLTNPLFTNREKLNFAVTYLGLYPLYHRFFK